MRDLIYGVIASTVASNDQEGMRTASQMIDAAFQKMILDMARHAHAVGCERCGELVAEMSAAANASDERAHDHASNALVSHLTLDADITDTTWLGGEHGDQDT